jgi:subtilisin family serine protease
MKNLKTLFILALAISLFPQYRIAAQSVPMDKITSNKPTGNCIETKLSNELKQKLNQLNEGDSISIIITFSEQLDLSKFQCLRASAEPMIRDLQALSQKSKKYFLDLLAAERMKTQVKFYWINNSAVLNATGKLIRMLLNTESIKRIDYNVPVRMEGNRNSVFLSGRDLDPVWNISKIKADSVWLKYNLDGTGIVLGSMDTGIDTSHPALRGKWRGGTNSWVDIINGRPYPYDDHGHGTATIGVMVGGDGPGTLSYDIGVAYGAKVICAKVLDSTNSFSNASVVIAGAQWMLDPDGDPATNDFPNIINNSWYFFSQGYTGFYSTVQAWRTAGIIPVFCIGNFGPGAETTRSPGDYNNCIGVGGTNVNDGSYTNTSQGPSPAGTQFPSDLRKPDISAPGQSVITAYLGGGYAYWTGTSFASPHIAATIGLMLQANANLSYNQILSIMENSSIDLGDPDYDFIFGYGRIDALSAIDSLIPSFVSTENKDKHLFALQQNYPNPFNPSTNINYQLPIKNFVSIKVFDILGREVSNLVNQEIPAGNYSVSFDGSRLSSGIYFYRIKSGSFTQTRKMILMK